MRSTFACSLLLFALGGCGLTLDYDPPEDGGIDAPGIDASLDAPAPGCDTDVDCADGDLCDGVERCVAGRCEEGEPVNCDDGDVCNGVDTCVPESGECITAPVAACEDDGDPCNGDEVCDAIAGCTHVRPLDCDDGVGCTNDTCVPGEGCASVPDDTLCAVTAGGVCLDDGCAYPTCEVGVTCTSDNPCLVPRCDGEGRCVREPMVCPGTDQVCCAGECVLPNCDDGIACTEDRCIRTQGCMNMPLSGVSCEDGDRCTVGDACDAGACVAGTPRPCVSTRDPCNPTRCEPSTGECVSELLDGTACVDPDACSVNDRCVMGTCTPGDPADCDDGEFCTVDACDPAMGCMRIPVPDGISCPGVRASMCMSGRCVPAASLCPDGTADCTGTGRCDCVGVCAVTPRLEVLCVPEGDCRATGCESGEACCDGPSASGLGRCFDRSCVSCCI